MNYFFADTGQAHVEIGWVCRMGLQAKLALNISLWDLDSYDGFISLALEYVLFISRILFILENVHFILVTISKAHR